MTTKINAAAKDFLRLWGVSLAELSRAGWLDGRWHGDVCGCQDDRCIGFHHDADEECGCLPVQVEDHLRETGQVRSWRCVGGGVDCTDVHPVQDWDQAVEAMREHARDGQHPMERPVTFRLTYAGERPSGLWSSWAQRFPEGSAQRPTS